MSIFNGKTIVLGAAGGVAIYKAVDLCSKLTQAGALVDVIMTPAAMQFVTPLMFASVTRREVHHNPWKPERRPEHIALAQRPDLIVVAPATANTMAKIAHGMADNLLTDTLLATDKPILLAPAMNCGMWNNPATRRNLETLRKGSYRFVGPGTGNLACGDTGIGRMAEVPEIMDAMADILQNS